MGYFIERATNPTTGFTLVGGVAPNVTSFTDNQLATGTHYWYRIRPSNSATGSLSQILSLAACSAPLYSLKDGWWTDATAWSCNRVPGPGDVVQVKHQLQLPVNYVATLQGVGFDPGKTLTYSINAQVKLGSQAQKP
ncbi:hypothetical protein M0L20_26325 [Spirosoma sp. RP8]|uniref:Fibronectin type-III domain-containing protein n=1 Tax=Spirosoma liriopis TaxID=2937440 RepID=A0ABT0HT88_9BACT|nr:hypothetical protein [Spirosoma liriopis]MCK8495409.1 hypothetical protein [Spirosoma liriopis]